MDGELTYSIHSFNQSFIHFYFLRTRNCRPVSHSRCCDRNLADAVVGWHNWKVWIVLTKNQRVKRLVLKNSMLQICSRCYCFRSFIFGGRGSRHFSRLYVTDIIATSLTCVSLCTLATRFVIILVFEMFILNVRVFLFFSKERATSSLLAEPGYNLDTVCFLVGGKSVAVEATKPKFSFRTSTDDSYI